MEGEERLEGGIIISDGDHRTDLVNLWFGEYFALISRRQQPYCV